MPGGNQHLLQYSYRHVLTVQWRRYSDCGGWATGPRSFSGYHDGMHSAIEIWSGGQTGVDRAALDAAIELGLPYGGWIPRGRRAEDGTIPEHYSTLRETASTESDERTGLNVRDTDATLVLTWGPARGGTLRTIEEARAVGHPLLEVDLADPDSANTAARVIAWLDSLSSLRRLNVAGPRASEAPVAYERSRALLTRVLGVLPRTQ